MKKLGFLLLAGFLLGGCTVTAHISGHTDDYAESFRGTSLVDVMSGEGQVQVAFERTGITCGGTTRRYYSVGGPGDKSRGDLKCNDGRTVHVENLRTEMKGGVGEGSDEYGIKARWRYHLSKAVIDSYHVEVKRKVSASGLGVEHILAKKKITSAKPEPPAPQPAPVTAAASLSEAPLAVTFKKGPNRPDDIAVIIGNADYSKQGKDIPNVTPAYADAEGFKRYVTEALGIREGNIIDLGDATSAQLERVFGNNQTHKGQLFDWVRAGVSRVYVYYAGHGAPGGKDGTAYLVPSDADASRIHINGYPLRTLYGNLGKTPARSITVVLEACFSGAAQGGAVISNASPVFMKSKAPEIPPNVTVISAGGANQMASWEKDKSHGLFTKYFLKGMSGEADADPHGNGDGKVGYDELERYLQRTLTYYARRYYGRDQTAVIVVGKGG